MAEAETYDDMSLTRAVFNHSGRPTSDKFTVPLYCLVGMPNSGATSEGAPSEGVHRIKTFKQYVTLLCIRILILTG